MKKGKRSVNASANSGTPSKLRIRRMRLPQSTLTGTSPSNASNKTVDLGQTFSIKPTRQLKKLKTNKRFSLSSSNIFKPQAQPQAHVNLSLSKLQQRQQSFPDCQAIAAKLGLKGVTETREIMDQLFDEVISRSTDFKGLLQQIKDAYAREFERQRWITSQEAQTQILQQTLVEAKLKLDKLQTIQAENRRQYQRLAAKEVKLARKLEKKEAELDKAEETIMNFASVKQVRKPPTENYPWNYLLQERKSYTTVISDVKNSVKRHKRSEGRLQALLEALSKNGLPVQEVISELEAPMAPEHESEISDYEPFSQRITGKPATRPSNVPPL